MRGPLTSLLGLCLGALGCTTSRVSSLPMQQLAPQPTSCAAVRSTDSTIYDTSQVTERAVPRSVPQLEYPAEARQHRVQGRPVVTAVVSAEGAVELPSVTITTSAHRLLDAEALRVVSATTFWPACRDEAAVRARIVVPFDFKISGNTAAVGFGVLAGLWAGVMGVMMQ